VTDFIHYTNITLDVVCGIFCMHDVSGDDNWSPVGGSRANF
jgi:hypothetical protein